MAILLGTLDSDRIDGTALGDIATGLSGADRITGFEGADALDGGSGDDSLYAGSRTAWDDGAVDTLLGDLGDDAIFGAWNDNLAGGIGVDRLYWDLSGSSSGVTADFRPMAFTVGLPLLDVGPVLRIGAAEFSGFEIVSRVIGSAFNDEIVTANYGRAAADLSGGAGDDRLESRGGADTLDGGSGDDRLDAGSGADRLDGGEGDDVLAAGTGADLLFGGAGADVLSGGYGRDVLTGGAGADLFLFAEADTIKGRRESDLVTDFDRAEGDRISLRKLDAVLAGEDDRFTVIGKDAFSGTAGELRVYATGADTIITGDVDGNGVADFSIRVEGAIVTSADLLL